MKYDSLVDEVQLFKCTMKYTRVRPPDGRKDVMSYAIWHEVVKSELLAIDHSKTGDAQASDFEHRHTKH